MGADDGQRTDDDDGLAADPVRGKDGDQWKEDIAESQKKAQLVAGGWTDLLEFLGRECQDGHATSQVGQGADHHAEQEAFVVAPGEEVAEGDQQTLAGLDSFFDAGEFLVHVVRGSQPTQVASGSVLLVGGDQEVWGLPKEEEAGYLEDAQAEGEGICRLQR